MNAALRREENPCSRNGSVRRIISRDGIYFAVIESEDGSFSIGLYEMFAGGSWLVDGKKRKVRYWAEQSSYDLPEELLRKGIA